jgi:hypothetical protein
MDGTVILLAAACLVIVLVSARSRSQRAADHRPAATSPPPRPPSSYGYRDPETIEDFYSSEDEFAVFADEDDEQTGGGNPGVATRQ